MSAIVHLDLKDLDLDTLEFHQQNILQSMAEIRDKAKTNGHTHTGFKKLLRVKRKELKMVEEMIASLKSLA